MAVLPISWLLIQPFGILFLYLQRIVGQQGVLQVLGSVSCSFPQCSAAEATASVNPSPQTLKQASDKSLSNQGFSTLLCVWHCSSDTGLGVKIPQPLPVASITTLSKGL